MAARRNPLASFSGARKTSQRAIAMGVITAVSLLSTAKQKAIWLGQRRRSTLRRMPQSVNAAAARSAWVSELWTKKTGYKAVAIVDARATGRLAIRRASRKTLYKAKAATSSMAIRATAGFHPLSESHRAR